MHIFFIFFIVPYGMKRPTIVTSSSREISLDWSAPDDLGGLPLLGYQMEATPDLGKTWQRRDHIFTSTNGSLSSLMPFTNYQIRIAGMNILGVGIFSDLSETVRTSADGRLFVFAIQKFLFEQMSFI